MPTTTSTETIVNKTRKPVRLDDLLAEEQDVTAVEKYAQKHDNDTLPANAKYYRDLMPVSVPGPDEQYAFEVDLDLCTGCKACVTACHSLNGLEEGETWRNVGMLVSHQPEAPAQQHVTTACHHCAEPACSHGCPVLAYEKDEQTGIVRHLDDQCIGCQYCTLKCPYEVPKYSRSMGIVRKCDMCYHRLSAGEAPACVQACPTQAIRITKRQRQEIAAPVEAELVPTSPASAYTLPSTVYKSARGLPTELRAGDEDRIGPAHAHLPLVVMLVATQLAVGMLATDAALALLGLGAEQRPWFALVEAVLTIGGVHLGILHLGRPQYAWRAFLGWRRSWLSREVIIFGMLMGAVAGYGSAGALQLLNQRPVWLPSANLFLLGSAGIGVIAVACSVMVYVDCHKPSWGLISTAFRFGATAWILGPLALLLVSAATGAGNLVPGLACTTLAATVVKLAGEQYMFRHWAGKPLLRPVLQLLNGKLAVVQHGRHFLAIAGGIILPAILIVAPASSLVLASLALILTTLSELAERYLFFVTGIGAKMPGAQP